MFDLKNSLLDKEKVAKLEQLRDKLIESLEEFDIPHTEKLFILKKIDHITKKLVSRAYKEPKSEQ